MKTIPPVLCLLMLVLLTSCARRYTITYTNGTRVTAIGKPKQKDGAYIFKDARGNQVSVPSMRIEEIAPEADASGYNFTPGSSR